MVILRKLSLSTSLLATALLLTSTLAGCSSASSTTCEDYGKQDLSGQTDTAMQLVREHNLDPTSNAVAVALIQTDIDTYCGITPTALLQGHPSATKHQDQKIDTAINWSTYTK